MLATSHQWQNISTMNRTPTTIHFRTVSDGELINSSLFSVALGNVIISLHYITLCNVAFTLHYTLLYITLHCIKLNQSCPRVGWTRGSGRVWVTILPDFGGPGRVSTSRFFMLHYNVLQCMRGTHRSCSVSDIVQASRLFAPVHFFNHAWNYPFRVNWPRH